MQLNLRRASVRAVGTVSIVALAVVAASCDRDSPMNPNSNEPPAVTGTTTAQGTVTFSARATGARSSVLGVGASLCGAGPLPSQGGEDGSVVLDARIQGVLQTSFFHSIVFGAGNLCRAQANSGDFDVMVAGQRLQGHLVAAGAQATCVNGSVVLWAGSNVVDLRINGQPVTVTGHVNQTVALPLGVGRVVINEQTRTASSITVRGLRVIVLGTTDVAISEAQAGIVCGQPDCAPQDCVTGCGWIGTPAGARGSFGLSAGTRAGAAWGRLAYVDNANGGPRVKSTGVASYSIVTSNMRRVQGPCEINGQAGFTYTVDVMDNGNADMFRIQLSNGYAANGSVQGGDITLNIPCR